MGTAFDNIQQNLVTAPLYTAFRHGEVDANTYQKWVEGEGSDTIKSLNEDQFNLSARFPLSKHDFVRRALSQCRTQDLISDDRYDPEEVEKNLVQLEAKYEHSGNMTYIFPEESSFLYALVRNERPRRAAAMGSYYGYWALSAKAANPDLHLALLDINPEVMDLAQRNFERLGLAHNTEFLVGDAEVHAASLQNVDLLLLDAEGPKSDEVPPDYRDKAIYYPHLRAALNSLAPGALVVAHNVILSNFTGGTYFEQRQKYYREQYAKFLPLIRQNFSWTVIDSTEGILIARKL